MTVYINGRPFYSADFLVAKAREIIKRNGKFLLAYEVVDAGRLSREDLIRVQDELHRLVDEISTRFADKIVGYGYFERGYNGVENQMILLSVDTGCVCLNDADVIDKIWDLADKLVSVQLRWIVAEDYWGLDFVDNANL